ncbi:hypothetical protein [Halomonas koreensis]|uniref:Uncharacterized protein n=1 Tax=Halomonas koreensis TaxID=245385 RepID=A0ABU1G183_9GAMM|nr:hypothetical protein [Halomonas koreensis]MDR5866684.1 hypothetical protein [Halomonas koreensis]
MKKVVFSSIPFLLTGCGGSEIDARIVDLAGVVFLFFILVIGVKYLSLKIYEVNRFKVLGDAILHRGGFFSIPVYACGAYSFSFGVLHGGLSKVLMLAGMVAIVTARCLQLAGKNIGNEKKRKFYVEVVFMGMTFFAALFFIFKMGSSMFSDFSGGMFGIL